MPRPIRRPHVTGAEQRALSPCTLTIMGITRAVQPWTQRTPHRPALSSPGLRSQGWPQMMEFQPRAEDALPPGKEVTGSRA